MRASRASNSSWWGKLALTSTVTLTMFGLTVLCASVAVLFPKIQSPQSIGFRAFVVGVVVASCS